MHADTEANDWMARLRARLRGFHGDEQGQSIVYLVLIMFLLACFTFMVINSGALLHDKMQAQSASDAAVMSGSTRMVRAMNLNSMMNIFLAMLLAEEIMMKAVFWTALTALLLAPAIEAFWLGVCLTTGTCNPAIDVVIDTFDLFPLLWETEDHEDAFGGVTPEGAWRRRWTPPCPWWRSWSRSPSPCATGPASG